MERRRPTPLVWPFSAPLCVLCASALTFPSYELARTQLLRPRGAGVTAGAGAIAQVPRHVSAATRTERGAVRVLLGDRVPRGGDGHVDLRRGLHRTRRGGRQVLGELGARDRRAREPLDVAQQAR